MNDSDWLRKRWKHRFHGCVLVVAPALLGGLGLAVHLWS